MKGLPQLFCTALVKENGQAGDGSWEGVFKSLLFLTKAPSICQVALSCSTKNYLVSLVHTGTLLLGRWEEGRRTVKAPLHSKGAEMRMWTVDSEVKREWDESGNWNQCIFPVDTMYAIDGLPRRLSSEESTRFCCEFIAVLLQIPHVLCLSLSNLLYLV